MAELHKLAQTMCSIDLAESYWTQELPRLPVPDLWLTVSRYLASLKAVLAPTDSLELLIKEHERQQLETKIPLDVIKANWNKYEHVDKLVKQFMLNEGPQLQRDLKEYANKCQNWATEYWLQDMYLSNPLPLPVNSNPFFMFPRQNFATSEQMLMFATRIIQFSVDFKYRIDQQALKQDFGSGHGKGKPLCMETYKNFFHSYRMPHEDMDRLLPQSRRSNHIVVASCNQFYILRLGQDPLDNPYRKDASSQMNESSIFEQLLRIYRVSREHLKREQHSNCNHVDGNNNTSSCKIPKVGLFTTENRKVWAKLHKKLSHCNGSSSSRHQSVGSVTANGIGNNQTGSQTPNTNSESLRQIEDCLFVMCLDSLVQPASNHQQTDDNNENNNNSNENISDEIAANLILTGGGTHMFTANRWFDKFLQIIVGRNGICGINIEHSASEGITVLRFLEEFIAFMNSNPINTSNVPATSPSSSQPPTNERFNYEHTANNKHLNNLTNQITSDSITSSSYVEPKSPNTLLEESDNIIPLSWTMDDELAQAIDEAETKVNKLIENFSLYILNFNHFGASFIKGQNLSPDAFVQLALQYAFYKLHGCLVSTYESASLRQFRLGRVDNIRANTCESYQWIQAMLLCTQTGHNDRPSTDSTSKYKQAEGAFIRAITKQVEILRYTILGGAPDNHVLALKELAKIRYGIDELPELFTDSTYKEFLNFRLSTSQLPNDSGITVGYGAVVPDGYGCSYNPRADSIVFCVSSFHDCPETSSSRFASTLQECLLEMQQLCLGRQPTTASKSINN